MFRLNLLSPRVASPPRVCAAVALVACVAAGPAAKLGPAAEATPVPHGMPAESTCAAAVPVASAAASLSWADVAEVATGPVLPALVRIGAASPAPAVCGWPGEVRRLAGRRRTFGRALRAPPRRFAA